MKNSSHQTDSIQIDLFAALEQIEAQQTIGLPVITAGNAQMSQMVRALVTDCIKRCTLSRFQIAARMSELLGEEISKSMLDTWTAESKVHHRFPLEYLHAFIEATGDHSILHTIANKCGGHYVEGERTVQLKLGQIAALKKELAETEKNLKKQLTAKWKI